MTETQFEEYSKLKQELRPIRRAISMINSKRVENIRISEYASMYSNSDSVLVDVDDDLSELLLGYLRTKEIAIKTRMEEI